MICCYLLAVSSFNFFSIVRGLNNFQLIFSRSIYVFQFQICNSGFLKDSDIENRQFLILCFLNRPKVNNLSLQNSWTGFSYFLKNLPFQRFQIIFQWKQMCPCVTMVYHSIPQHIFLQFQTSIFGSIFFKYSGAVWHSMKNQSCLWNQF